MRRNIYIAVLSVFAITAVAYGARPLDALKNSIDESIQVLNDPRYQSGDQKQAQLHRLKEISRQIFNFREFSKRVLAKYWKKFTPQQRKEFTDVFAEFLTEFYLAKLLEEYTDEKVVYSSQLMVTNTKALVEIKVLWKKLEVPVKVKMILKQGAWKAYDLTIFGISAAHNYRAQFQYLLRKETPAQVIERLRKRVEKIKN